MNNSRRLDQSAVNIEPIAPLFSSQETPEMVDLHKKVNRSAAAALLILAATATTALTVAALPVALLGAGAVVGLAVAGYALKTSRTVQQQMVQREKIIKIANQHLSDPEPNNNPLIGLRLNDALEAHAITYEEYASVIQDTLKKTDFETVLRYFGNKEKAKPLLKQAWVEYLHSDAPLKLRNVTLDQLMSTNTTYDFNFSDEEMKEIRHEFAASALAIFKEKGEIPGMKEIIYTRGGAEFDNLEMYEELLNYVPLDNKEIVNFVQDQVIKRLNRNAFAPGSEIRRCWEEDEEYLKENTNLNVEQRDFILIERFKIGVNRRVQNNAKWEQALKIYEVLDNANDLMRHKRR